MSLEKAPDHIKLAVDLIEILESNDLEIDTVIEALKIVLSDFENKQNNLMT